MNLEDLFSTPQGILLMGLLGIILSSLLFGVKQFKVAERKHLTQLAGALSDAGVPEILTTPIADLSVGDDAGAIGALFKAIEFLKTPAGFGQVVSGMVAKAMTDPTRKAALLKAMADIQSGASSDQISSDVQGMASADPLSKVVGNGPLASAFQNISGRLQLLKQNPALSPLLGIFGNLPQDVQTHLTGIVDAAHQLGAKNATSGTTTPSGPTNSVTVPDGHVVTISKAPATDANTAA